MPPTAPDGLASARWLDTSALTDPTRCPACGAPLTGRRCPACRLDVSGPDGRELWRLSREAATILGKRSEVIAQMRVPAAASASSQVAYGPPGAPVATGKTAAQEAPGPSPVALPRAAMVTPPPLPPPPTTRPGWALQTILQVLGAILLAGAGLVFTVFAWGHLGLTARGAILVAITAAVFVGARRAARAGLRSAAEVLAALGSVLVVLDGWVLWTAAVDGGGGDGREVGAAFTAALVIGAVVLVPLGRALALTTASVVGLVSLTVAPAVLGLTISSAQATAYLLALSVALCLYGPRLLGTHALAPEAAPPSGQQAPAVVGPVALVHAQAVIGVLAPFYLAMAAMATLVTFVDAGSAPAVGPLLAIAVVSGLWAAATPGSPSRPWSAVAGCAVAGAGMVAAVSFASTSVLAAAWRLPLGAAVGCAVTVGVLRVLPRLGAQAARAAWVVVLLAGALPVLVLAVLTVTVLGGPEILQDLAGRSGVLHVLAGLCVLVAARPLLHLLGAQQVIGRPPVPVPTPVRTPAGQLAFVPRPPSVLVDLPLGASVVAATVLALGLPLLVPGADWAAVTLLVLATVVALARTPLVDGIRAASAALAPSTDDQIAALVRGCVAFFCAVAVTEAAVVSFALATGADGAVSRATGEALVATTFAVAGLLLWVARGWIPAGDVHRGSNRAALAFASLVIASVGAGVLVRLVGQLDGIGWYAAPFPLVLALVLLGVRDLRAARAAVEPSRGIGADRLAALGAATVLCGPGVVVTARTALTWAGQPLAVALLATALLMMTVALTWQLGFAATAAGRELRASAGALLPVTGVLTLLSLRPLAAAADLPLTRLDWALTVLGLLVVLITWAGARTSGVARVGCELAVVVLAGITTTTVVVSQGDPSRMAIALAICGVGASAYAVAAGRPRWGWLALCLGVSASWVSLGGTGLPVEAYTVPGGAVILATGVWQLVASLRAGAATDRSAHAVRLVLGGLTVLVLPSVLLTPGAGADGRAVVVTVGVLWLGGTAWLLTRTAVTVALRLRPLVIGMTVLALVGAVVGLGGHAVAQAAQVVAGAGGSELTTRSSHATGLTTRLWTAVAVLVTAVLAAQLAQVSFPRPAPADPQPTVRVGDPRVWAATACTILLTAPVTVLLSGGWFASASAWAAGALVTVWGAAALLGTPPGVPRVRSPQEFALRAVPALIGVYATAVIGSAAASSGARAGAGGGHGALAELLTLAGVFVAIVTVRAAQVASTSSTWTTVASGAVATILPLTLKMIAEPSGGWIAAAMITAAAWLVLGARLRWQAPLACGAVALLVQVLVLAGPPALAAMSGMLGWIVLAAVGGALLTLGLTYERQITTARRVLRRYSELR